MDKYKTRLLLFSAIFFAFMITPIHGHDEEMSSEEITVMIQEILNSVGDLGEKTLKDAKDVMATIKIETGHRSLPDLIEETSPAVVRIAIRGKMKSQPNPFFDDPFFERFFGQPQMPREREFGGGGSGVIVDGELGYIITNAHVIDRADEIKVFTKDGDEYDAEILGSDKGTDIALIKISSDEMMPEIQLGNSDSVRVGDSVVAIGAPFGLSQTVTSGIISALGRPQMTADGFGEMIQTDAAINPGNSGGALIDLDGKLIGVPSSIFTRGGGNIGIGFAIPVSTIKNITSQIIDFGSVKRGLLGVIISDLSEDVSEQLGLDIDKGALIQEVSPDSAAENAGLEPGDVIINVDGKEIENVNDLRNAIGLKRSGERVKVVIIRNNREMTKNAKLGEIAVQQTVQA
ncbi:MAG: trypsin-like peptidase domain-containing protein, partial [Gammaproteobacteria bacterium]|nr:trypsin-like peptidase domain-containing protein [Gammaproteobacteria bacterium]